MGCHIGFYKVLDKPSFNIEELKLNYLKQIKEAEIKTFKSPWNKLDLSYPFYYMYTNYKEPLTNKTIREGYLWLDGIELNNKCLTTLILPLKNNSLLYQFKDKAFQIPCVQYKGRKSKLVRTYPYFLEFEEQPCPWVRIYPYGAMFTTKESLLRHLKNQATDVITKSDYEFFSQKFINGQHLVYLG